jgi:hypothetical protein
MHGSVIVRSMKSNVEGDDDDLAPILTGLTATALKVEKLTAKLASEKKRLAELEKRKRKLEANIANSASKVINENADGGRPKRIADRYVQWHESRQGSSDALWLVRDPGSFTGFDPKSTRQTLPGLANQATAQT